MIDQELALRLAEKHNLRYFVETGTHNGKTAAWAASNFVHVRTVEMDETYHGAAWDRLSRLDNVALYHGRSESHLREMLLLTNGAALVWLDAIATRALFTAATPAVISPIQAEISIVNADGRPHVVMVGNMDVLGRVKGLPSEDRIMKMLRNGNNRRVYTEKGIIVGEPN